MNNLFIIGLIIVISHSANVSQLLTNIAFEDWSALKNVVRPFDGSGSNLNNSTWGKVGSVYDRIADNFQQANRPNARIISNTIGVIESPIVNSTERVTMLFTIFGQFIDHDFSRTLQQTYINKKQRFDILIPSDDPQYIKDFDKLIRLDRNNWILDANSKRQIIDSTTPAFDASTIYGTSQQKSKTQFREVIIQTINGVNFTNVTGKLDMKKLDMNGNEILPNKTEQADDRANTNYVLQAIHIVFSRLHNALYKVVSEKAAAAGNILTEDEKFNIARNFNIAIIQHITYDQFLPILLGPGVISNYSAIGYSENERPNQFIQVNTAAFRYGHPMIPTKVTNLNKANLSQSYDLKALFGGKFNTDLEWTNKMIRGSSMTLAKRRSFTVVNDLRNVVSTVKNITKLIDVLALDIQRGRDHEITTYGKMKFALFGQNSTFADFSDNQTLKGQLSALFNGSPDNMDLVVGIMGEKKVGGSILGRVGREMLRRTFQKVRRADRFWYQRESIQVLEGTGRKVIGFFNRTLISNIKSISFEDVLRQVVPGVTDLRNGFILP